MKYQAFKIPAIAFATLMFSSAANSAVIFEDDGLEGAAFEDLTIADVDTPINTASVFLKVDDDGIATLVGDVDNTGEILQLERAVEDIDGIKDVVNHLTY